MKKKIGLLLTVAIMGSLLGGCGGTEKTTSAPAEEKTTQTEKAAKTEEVKQTQSKDEVTLHIVHWNQLVLLNLKKITPG